jgi:ABC-2 type transport system permease protein
MQYRASFLLLCGGNFAATLAELLAVLILFRTFGRLGGWRVGEVALLYGLVSLGLALAELFGKGFDGVSALIRSGQLDRVLTRPVSPFVQVMSAQFPLRHLGRAAQGLFALALAQRWASPLWTPASALVLASALGGTMLVFMGVLVMGAALCFWTVERTEAQNVFSYGGAELAGYPMHIYGPWLRGVFLYLVPLALTVYYPALYILGKPDPLGLPGWLQFIALPVGAAFFCAALLVWRAGLNHYASTGS